ncbi:MAG: sugar ABC transporter permease [Oscillospiraceae bacterium]|jgi:putative aldouronate transport system permease protein|nr:sugar ABC transporter permease [Oscillospiraceae bacterium]
MSVSLEQSKPKTSLGKNILAHFKRYWRLHVLALPAFAYMIIFSYLPMFGITLAFQDYKVSTGFFHSKWVGLKNFEFLFSNNDVWRITRNTICYNVAFIVLNTVLAVTLAIIFNEIYYKRTSKILQTLAIMPNFLSMTVVAIIVYGFLATQNGVVNQIMKAVGGQVRNWYGYKAIWPPLLIITYLWKNIGFSSIVYVASLSGLPQEYFEAALLDGASKWQQTKYISIPYMRNIITIMFILNLGGIIRGDIGLFRQVTQDSGALYEVTDVIDTYVYRALTTLNNTGMSAAAGVYQSVVGFILILVANAIVRRVDEDSALF